jgi:hypothetical protein
VRAIIAIFLKQKESIDTNERLGKYDLQMVWQLICIKVAWLNHMKP